MIATPVTLGTTKVEFTAIISAVCVRKTGVFRTLPLQAKGLCWRHYRRRPLGGISEQASMAVDMGKFSVLAMFRQIIRRYTALMLHHAGKSAWGGVRGVFPGGKQLG
jgi:hypothetical protein